MNFRGLHARLAEALFDVLDHLVRCDSKLSMVFILGSGLVSRSLRQIKLLPAEWLDENKTGFIETLDPEQSGYSHGPLIDGSQCTEQVKIPAVNLYYFENASVCADSSSIVLHDRIIIERLGDVELERCNFATGHIKMHGKKICVVMKRPMEHLDKGIFLGGNGSFNYYHWMLEILPKLQFLRDLGSEYDDYPLLVSEEVERISTFREALALIVTDRPLVTLDRGTTYCIGNLVYINAPNNCPFNLRGNQKVRVSDFLFRDSSIDFLRSQLSSDRNKRVETVSARIFLARRGRRRSYNQDEVYGMFKRQGFDKVFMEEMSLKRQIELISNCEMVAGPTGAAWTNLLFCRKGTKCLCWMSEASRGFSAYSNLARIAGIDLRYVIYESGATSTGDVYSMDYRLDIGEIQNQLEELLSKQA